MPTTSSTSPSHRVLLVLDAQHGFLSDPPVGVPSARALRANIAIVLARARASAEPPLIVHVRNTGDFGELDEPHTAGWELEHTPLAREHVIDKKKNNAFTGTRLDALIAKDAEIVIVGTQSDFSVRATCSAALGRGNDVILIRGAHGTFDRIEVLHGGGVTPATRVQEEVEGELEEAGVNLLEMSDLEGIFDNR